MLLTLGVLEHATEELYLDHAFDFLVLSMDVSALQEWLLIQIQIDVYL